MSEATARCLTRASAVTLVAGWILVALFVGEMELLRLLPFPGVQLLIAGITAFLLVAYWRSSLIRAFVDELPLRALVAVHLTRFVGVYFLVLHARAELPYAFAVPGGWGDIAVAAGAALVASLPPLHSGTRVALLAWNAFGLLDIVAVVITATRLTAADPASMVALTRLPLSFVPLMIVPLIVTTHVILFVRLLRKRAVKARAIGTQPALPL